MVSSGTPRRRALFLSILLMACALFPQAASAAQAGASPETLAAAVEAFAAEHRDTTAGAAVAVINGQETVLESYYGYADLAAERPTGPETVFEWGSITKLLVWTSVMQLVERGELDLNADIAGYLPENFLKRRAYDDPITMMNLMHHDAGWEDVIIGLFVDPASYNGATLEESLRALEPVQSRRPGHSVGYSNYGAALAGYVVERISGQPFYAYVRQHIFEPLGMERTSLHPTLDDNAWVKAQRPLSQGYAGLTPTRNDFVIPLYPAGMATGTLGDLVRFAKALLPGRGESPLFEQSATLDEMLSATLYYGDSGLTRNSHGFWVMHYQSPVLGHGGNTAAFSANLLIEPRTGTGVLVMTNQANETVYNGQLPELIFGPFDPSAVNGSPADARTLAGVYQSSRTIRHGLAKLYGLTMTIPLLDATEDSLRTSVLGHDVLTLKQTAANVYVEEAESGLPIGDFLYADVALDGAARLSMPYMDFVRIPTFQGILPYILLALFALAIIYSALALIVRFVRWTVAKHKGAKLRRTPLTRPSAVMRAFIVLSGVNLAWLIVNLLGFESRPLFMVNIAINILFLAVAAAYALVVVLRFRLPDMRRSDRTACLFTLAAGLVSAASVVFFQLYRF